MVNWASALAGGVGIAATQFNKERREDMLIAQEMQKVIPEAVVEDDTEDKYLSVAYGSLIGVLIEAVKELSEEVSELKKSIRTIEFKEAK